MDDLKHIYVVKTPSLTYMVETMAEVEALVMGYNEDEYMIEYWELGEGA
jgi:hypothetical protein